MESKQDVFDSALDELRYAISLAKEPVAAEDLSSDELLDDLRARYAAAGKVAVPEWVGRYIDDLKHETSCIIEAWETAYKEGDPEVHEWVQEYESKFAEAWNHGWAAEEDAK
jgi:hypothetical protein